MQAFIKFVGIVVCGILISTGPSTVRAETRVALVIGNNDYRHDSLPDLNNARKDAEGMAAKLEQFGFEVIKAINADQIAMGRALADFENRLTKADVGLVFYAGHGIQSGGRNFLIPVDARLEREADLRFQGIDANEILAAMEFADVPTNIIILDACRDNPLPQRSRSAARGLRAMEASLQSRGIAVLYSAAPGQAAQDGPPGEHSPFTGELLNVMDTPGLKIEEVFKETAQRVASRTGNAQDPFMTFNIKGDFIFNLQIEQAAAVPTPAVPTDKETIFW